MTSFIIAFENRPSIVVSSYARYYYERRFELHTLFDFLDAEEKNNLLYHILPREWFDLGLTTHEQLLDYIPTELLVYSFLEAIEQMINEEEYSEFSDVEPKPNTDFLDDLTVDDAVWVTNECPVMLENTDCVKFECGHHLGVDSYRQLTQNTCPLCRADIRFDTYNVLGVVGFALKTERFYITDLFATENVMDWYADTYKEPKPRKPKYDLNTRRGRLMARVG